MRLTEQQERETRIAYHMGKSLSEFTKAQLKVIIRDLREQLERSRK